MKGKDVASLLLCLCVALSTAQGWRPKLEYNFELNGRTVASLPSVGDHATGIHYRGQLRVQSYASDVLFMQLRNLSYTRINKDMTDGWWGTPHDTEDNNRAMPISDSTFSVKLKNGLVENVVVTSSLENWELNFVQGIVSHLQFDLTGSSAMHNSRSNSMHGRGDYENLTTYSVIEEAVSGRCEVQYTINQVPKTVMWANPGWAAREDLCGSRPFMEITKVRNYRSCDKNPEYHFGLPVSSSCEPGSDRCGDIWTRASLSRLVGCGTRKDFMLLAVVNSNRMVANLHLHNGTEAAVNSYVNLTLVSSKPLSRRLGLPTQPTRRLQSLTYRYSVPFYQVPESIPPSRSEFPESVEYISANNLRAHHQRNHSSKNKHKNSRHKRSSSKVRSSTTPSYPSIDLLPDASDEDEGSPTLWEVPEVSYNRPPHRPFSAFSLSHREGDAHSCMNQQFKELVTDIAGNMESPKHINEKKTLEKVNLAVEMCRTMMLMDLQKSHAGIMDFSTRDSKLIITERAVLRDIYVMCGTNPSFTIIKSWITQKKIKGEEAADVIASLPSNLLTPNANIVQQFYEMSRHSAVVDDEQVKISAVLAFSNLLRVACVNTRYRRARYTMEVMGPPCNLDIASRYLPWLTSQLRSDPALRRVFLTALGNTAHPAALVHLKKIAEDSSMTPYLRTVAVFSMRYHVFADPEGMSQLLLSLFHNYNAPISVRLAAVSMLMYSKSGLSTYQRIAISTWYEPSPAMVSFVWSSLKSMSEAKDTTYQTMFEKAKAVLPLAKRVSLASHFPANFMKSVVSEELGSIVLDQLSYSSNVEASNIYMRQTRRLGKMTTIVSQAEIWAANPDGLLELIYEFMNPKEGAKTSRPPLSNLARSTRWIHEELKIAARTMPRIEGDLHFTLNNLYERMIPFDKKAVNDFLKAGRRVVDQVKNGKQYHYQKMDQDGIVIATTNEMGFPVSLNVKTLSVLQSSIEAKLSTDHMHLDANFHVMYASQLMAELTAYHEWDGMEYMAASYGTTVINLPSINMKSVINKTNGQAHMNVMMQFDSPSENVRLVSHSSRPFVAYRDVFNLNPITLTKNTYFFPITDQRQLITIPHLDVTYASNGEPRSLLGWFKNDMNLYQFPMMWNTLEPASFEMDLIEMAPVRLNFTIATAETKRGQITFRMLGEDPPNDYNEPTDASIVEPPALSQESLENESNYTSSEEKTASPPTTVTGATGSDTSTTSSTTASTLVTEETENTQEKLTKPEEEPDIEGDTAEKLIIDNLNPKVLTEFNATSVNPFYSEVQGNYFRYLLYHVLTGIDNGEAFVIGVNYTTLTENPEKYEALVTYGNALGGNTKRIALHLKDQISNWVVCLTSQLYFVPGPLLDVNQMVNRNVTSRFSVDLVNHHNETASIATLTGTMTRSEEQVRKLRSSRDVERCLQDVALNGPSAYVHASCRSVAREAAFSDHITVHLNLYPDDYNRYHLGWVNQSFNAVAKVSRSAHTASFWMRTPSKEIEQRGIGIPFALSTLLLRLNTGDAPEEKLLGSGSCGITSDNVTTYDGVHFNYHMGNCWHVLTKDCSGKSRVVVLGRTEKNVTVAEINVDNYRIISLLPELQIALNQEPVSLSPLQATEVKDLRGNTIAQVSTSPDHVIKVRLPENDITVLYANSSILISAGFGNSGRLCGLCGDRDGEQVGDLKTPRGGVEQSPTEFARSYALYEDNCRAERDP